MMSLVIPPQDELHTCHGELFSEAIASICHSPQVVAVGINCTHPRFITVSVLSGLVMTSREWNGY